MKFMQNVRILVRDVREWLVSYIMMLIIPIVICSVFFLYTYMVIWEETKNSNIAALQFIASDLEQVFEESFLLEYNVQNNKGVKEAADFSQPLNAEKRYLMKSASAEITKYVGNDNWLGAGYVYFPKSDTALTVAGTYMPKEEIYSRLGVGLGYTEEEWSAVLNQKNNRIYISNQITGNMGYISSLPLRESAFKMNMIIMFDENYLQRLLSTLDYMQGSGLMLTDSKNNILLNRNLKNIDGQAFEIYAELTQDYQTVSINGEKVMAAGIPLQGTELKLVSVVPYAVFWETALGSLGYFLFALFICMCIGIGVAYFFSLGQKNTWGKFRSIVRQKVDTKTDALYFRSKEISTAIDNIVQEYDTMQKKLSSVESIKKEILLTAALNGRIRPTDIRRVFAKNELCFGVGYFAVIIFRVRYFEQIFESREDRVSQADIGLIRQSVISMIQDLSQSVVSCEILSQDERIVCIVNFGELEREVAYSQIEKIEKIKDAKEDEILEVFQTISISDVHKDVVSLHGAYSEAVKVMEYQIVTEEALIMSYKKMVQETEMSYLYSLENETSLIHFIYEGKKEEAIQLFEEIYEKNVTMIKGSESLNQCLIWNLTASVLRAENELAELINLPKMHGIFDYIDSNTTLYEAKNILVERIIKICEEVIEAKKDKGNIVAEQVKEYIREHYTDSNLSNTEIAECFHMNVSYLSTFFKEKTGITPPVYIQRVRLEEAKKLLLNTNLTIEAISERVGCNAAITLVRLFKKYEGVTPTVYAKQNKKN